LCERALSVVSLPQYKYERAGTKIRLGFLSQHFTNNAVGEWFQGFPQLLDRDRFEIYCFNGAYSIDVDTDFMYKRIASNCDKMIFAGLAADQVANM
jgi:predicted O-linked N-acetylglucosamine transferase (SPINDLY family)